MNDADAIFIDLLNTLRTSVPFEGVPTHSEFSKIAGGLRKCAEEHLLSGAIKSDDFSSMSKTLSIMEKFYKSGKADHLVQRSAQQRELAKAKGNTDHLSSIRNKANSLKPKAAPVQETKPLTDHQRLLKSMGL